MLHCVRVKLKAGRLRAMLAIDDPHRKGVEKLSRRATTHIPSILHNWTVSLQFSRFFYLLNNEGVIADN